MRTLLGIVVGVAIMVVNGSIALAVISRIRPIGRRVGLTSPVPLLGGGATAVTQSVTRAATSPRVFSNAP